MSNEIETVSSQSAPGKPRRKRSIPPELLPYAGLALGSFACALLLLVLLFWKADVLFKWGLVGRFYYLILLPLGLSCAAFLFGAMRSFAIYRGRHIGGAFELGGPVVGFGLVVLGGFAIPPPEMPFTVTVFVHGESGRDEIPLRNDGAIFIDFGGDRRPSQIGARGEAVFQGVSARFLGDSLNVGIEGVPYELTAPGQRRLESEIYLEVRRKPARITGRVRDEKNNAVAEATVSASNVSVKSDSTGHFELLLPSAKTNANLTLEVTAPGFTPWSRPLPDGYGTNPDDTPYGVKLYRDHK